MRSGAVERVVLVSRDLPLLESSNAAVLLAGLGLDPELEVDERLGGAPATLDAVSSARPRTLIIGADLDPAGAAAILTADDGLQVRTAARVARSLPVRTRNATGAVHDYGDPRLLHERGLVASLAAAGWTPRPRWRAWNMTARWSCASAIRRRCRHPARAPACSRSRVWPSAGTTGPLVAVEQASLSGHDGEQRRVPSSTGVNRPRGPRPRALHVADADIPISLAAYERAFEAKTRWEAGQFADASERSSDFPPRVPGFRRRRAWRRDYELVPLPRTGTVYTETTVHMPVPGLRTPYSLVIVELDGVGVRALVKVTGARAGNRGHRRPGGLTLRRVAVRSGVPDYGYVFEPERAPRERSSRTLQRVAEPDIPVVGVCALRGEALEGRS